MDKCKFSIASQRTPRLLMSPMTMQIRNEGPCGSVVKCLTRNQGVLDSSRTGSYEFFRGSVFGHFRAPGYTGKTQERDE